jgi:hypothetical protein
MKNITIIFLVVIGINCHAQDMKLANADRKTNYEMMRNGKFVQEIKNPKASPEYYFTIIDSIRSEYSQQGKFVTKSKLTFISPKKQISVVRESTVPGFECHLNEVVETRVLQTSTKDGLIRIKERIGKGQWHNFVLRKLE